MEEVVKLSVNKDVASLLLIKSHPELFASRNTITVRLQEDNDDTTISGPIIKFTCRTGNACYKIKNMADVPKRYPYAAENHVLFLHLSAMRISYMLQYLILLILGSVELTW